MTQEVRVTLTLKVDASQSKEDITSFVNHAISKRSIQDVPAGAFKESGTSVPTKIVIINKQ